MKKSTFMFINLTKILSIGTRVYDILAVLTIASGANILTGLFMNIDPCPIEKFVILLISGLLFILSGITFSWLTYWIRKYLEEFSNYSIDIAAGKIREDNKERQFNRNFIFALMGMVIAFISLILAGRI